MKQTDIAHILGVSKTTVSQVINKHNKHVCSHLNFGRIIVLAQFEDDFLTKEFASKIFEDICNLVLQKSSIRDTKNYLEIRRFAKKCKQWNTLLKDDKNIENCEPLQIIGMDMDVMKIFLSENFFMLCEIAQSKTKDRLIIEKACELQNAYINLKKKIRK